MSTQSWDCTRVTRFLRDQNVSSAGRIAEIWRFPVSSVGGEKIAAANLGQTGIAGDRLFGLIDARTGKPAAPEKELRWRAALHLTATLTDGEFPRLTFPDGQSYFLDDPVINAALSDYFGFAAAVAAHSSLHTSIFPLTSFRHPHFPVHVLTTASIAHLAGFRGIATIDSRRFRPTMVIESREGGFPEHQWIGRQMALGSLTLLAEEPTKRCGVTFVSQPGLPEDPEILRCILRHNHRNFGIYCSVINDGEVHLGDDLQIAD